VCLIDGFSHEDPPFCLLMQQLFASVCVQAFVLPLM
jgi:hypothetical protein